MKQLPRWTRFQLIVLGAILFSAVLFSIFAGGRYRPESEQTPEFRASIVELNEDWFNRPWRKGKIRENLVGNEAILFEVKVRYPQNQPEFEWSSEILSDNRRPKAVYSGAIVRQDGRYCFNCDGSAAHLTAVTTLESRPGHDGAFLKIVTTFPPTAEYPVELVREYLVPLDFPAADLPPAPPASGYDPEQGYDKR